MIIIVMGPAGAGKTTVGEQLARDLGWTFYDADALHSPDNVARMRGGTPLDERDRAPWLDAIATLIRSSVQEGQDTVIACSALREAHRRQLHHAAKGEVLWFVYLYADPELLAARLSARHEHFFPVELLASQLAALQEPSEKDAPMLKVDAAQPVRAVVHQIRTALEQRSAERAP